MKLTAVTTKQSTPLNLNDPWNRVQMNTEDLSGLAIVKRMKLWNTVEKKVTTQMGSEESCW